MATDFYSVEEREAVKANVVPALMKRGWPRDKAEECADLAVHAVESALGAIDRITNQSDNSRVNLQALVLASNFVAQRTTDLYQKALPLLDEMNMEGRVRDGLKFR